MNQTLLFHIILHKPWLLSIIQQSAIMTQSPLVSIIAGAVARKPDTRSRKKISQPLVDQEGLFSIIACSLTDNIAENMKNINLIGYLLKIRIFWKKTELTCTLDKCISHLLQYVMIVNNLLEERAENLTRTNHFCEKLLGKV